MKLKTRILIVILAFLIGGTTGNLSGQDPNNPFELVPRLEIPTPSPDSADRDTATDQARSGNPFDLVREPDGAPARSPDAFASAPVSSETSFRRLKLGIILFILILLAFLLTVLRSLMNKSVGAFFNDNLMNLLYPEQEGRGVFPFLILYGMFFLNAGVFIFFLLRYYDLPMPGGYLRWLLYCLGGVSGFFIFKHLILALLAYIFPIEKEVSRYNFIIILFGILVGLMLVPANILMAYGSEQMLPYIVYGVIGAIGLLYAFRLLRSLVVANKFLLFHKFHFLLYICTVEIAPVLFLAKLIINEL